MGFQSDMGMNEAHLPLQKHVGQVFLEVLKHLVASVTVRRTWSRYLLYVFFGQDASGLDAYSTLFKQNLGDGYRFICTFSSRARDAKVPGTTCQSTQVSTLL